MARLAAFAAAALLVALFAAPAAANYCTINGKVICDACWNGKADGNDTGAIGALVSLTCDVGKGPNNISTVSVRVSAADGSFHFNNVQTVKNFPTFKGCTIKIASTNSKTCKNIEKGATPIDVLTPSGSKILQWQGVYTVPTMLMKPDVKAPYCCNKAGSLCGDPRLVGGDGVPFWFHGQRDGDFCVVSDRNLHINAHFIGKPTEEGHDLTWVQAVAILFGENRLYVGTQQEAEWNPRADHLLFALNGEVLLDVSNTDGESVFVSEDAKVTVTRSGKANIAKVEIENLMAMTVQARPIGKDKWTAESCFAHLDMGFEFNQLSGNAEGVLGQTYQKLWTPPNVREGSIVSSYILHDVPSYTASSLFATDCPVSIFEALPYDVIQAGAGAHKLAVMDDAEETEQTFSTLCANDKHTGGLNAPGAYITKPPPYLFTTRANLHHPSSLQPRRSLSPPDAMARIAAVAAILVACLAVPAAAHYCTFSGKVICDLCWNGKTDKTDPGAGGAVVKMTCDLGQGSHPTGTVRTAADGSYHFGNVQTVKNFPTFKGCSVQIISTNSKTCKNIETTGSVDVLTADGSKVLQWNGVYTVPDMYMKPDVKAPTCCNKPGALCGDPRLVGGDGVPFWFHGFKDGDFCIVSDRNVHINAHFIGKSTEDGHDLTWVQAVAVLFGENRLYVGTQQEAEWNPRTDHLLFALNGEVLLGVSNTHGETVYTNEAANVKVTRSGKANIAKVEIENLMAMTVEVRPIAKDKWTEDSCFAHLDMGFEFNQLSGAAEGVLGQTYQKMWTPPNVPEGTVMKSYILHDVPSYTSSSLFSVDCPVSIFEALPYNVIQAGAGAHKLAIMDDVEENEEIASTLCSNDKKTGGLKCTNRR
eukprot:SM000192S04921  [mRNA]  locus=s192:225228:233230:- [translate_table: standard]